MSDQGFLNQVYQNDWHEIGFVNNANLALYKFQRKFWDDHKIEDINIIHFTMQKPWKCRPNGPYAALCKIWNEAE
jgi:lipopolysaccharide biosynthesis glycosyltransferase